METTNVRRQIAYEGFNNERWLMTIGFDNKVTVTCNGETRIYQIPESINITKIEHDTEYVYLYVESGKFYQFKFEIDNFLVGDIYRTSTGEFLDTFAHHVFGEEL